jgi:hypothetical protein
MVFAMECVVLLADSLMSSHSFWFIDAILTHFGLKSLLPIQPGVPVPLSPISTSKETFLFDGTFVVLFLLYFLAVRCLPGHISYRYILLSTLLLGGAYVFLPVITSQDVFSYIAYARMGVLYHLNPLTTLPTSISRDPVYPFLYWVNQPSAYGPTWAIITYTLQWLALALGFKYLLSMQLLLRLFGLSMHLGSTQLVWSLSGRLQHLKAGTSPVLLHARRQRLRATLAFAWNPFLLLEACVNAHNDATILFLVLLALWFLSPRARGMQQPYLLAVVLLAMAACLKITLVLLLPGLLLFLWTRQTAHACYKRDIRSAAVAIGVYACVILLLYTPFWQHGTILRLLLVTPGMSHDINSVYEILIRLYSSIRGAYIAPFLDSGSQIEVLSHQVSLFLFAIAYGVLCLRSLAVPRYVNTLPALTCWMAFAWFLYCIVGSPWFWPWYTITLFGLSALIEASYQEKRQRQPLFGFFPVSRFARALSISMLSLYSLSASTPINGSFPFFTFLQSIYENDFFPFLPHFQWMYLRGLWIWMLPFLVISFSLKEQYVT